MTTDIDFINTLADTARKIAVPYFRADYACETKSDASPVTEADRAIEAALREMIDATYPQDGIIGEEFGIKSGTSGYDWVLDPIDGTRPFMVGLAHFTTLISRTKDGLPFLGCIDQPILKDRWIGNGDVTDYNGEMSRSSDTTELADAVICSTGPTMFYGTDYEASFLNLEKKCKMMHWGGDAMLYASLASGRVDIVVETDLAIHDFCALSPIVNGAGGVMTDWDGKSLTTSSDGRVLACATKELHEKALEILTK